MDPIQPIGPRISNIPAVERVGHRIDPEQQKREQQKKDQQRHQRKQPEEPDEDDGLPHIDVCC